MPFVNPFLNPLGTAEQMIDEAPAAASSLVGLAALAPIGIGTVAGIKALRSNEGGFLAGLSTNSMGSTAAKVGDNLRGMQKVKTQVQEEMAQKLWEELIEGGGILKNLREDKDFLNVELQAISDLMRDPAAGIDATKASLITEKLKAVMLNIEGGIEDQAQRQLATVVDTLKNSSVQRDLFEKYHKAAERAKQHIAAPNISIQGRNPKFTKVTGSAESVFASLNPARRQDARRAYEQVQSLFGGRPGHQIQLFSGVEGVVGDDTLGKAVYAKIDTGRGKPLTVPISFARTADTGGGVIARAGTLATPYSTSQYFLNAKATEEFMHASTTGLRGRVSGGFGAAMHRPEVAFIEALGARSKEVGGLEHVQSKWFYEFQRTFFERLPRAASGLDEEVRKQHLGNLGTRTSFAHILGMENLANPKAFRGNLVTTDAGGLFESSGDAEIRNLVGGGRYGQIGITSGSSIISNQRMAVEGGISDLERRVLTPVEARIEQMYDRGGMSYVTQGKVQDALEIAGDIANGGVNKAVLLDFGSVSGNDKAGRRTGLSPGEFYMGGQQRVREMIQPTVLDPHAMTAGGKPMMSTDLYNELIGRFNEGKGRYELQGRKQIDAFFRKFGSVLGSSGVGQVSVKRTGGMQRLVLGLESVSDAGGQVKVHFGGFTETAYGGAGEGTLRHGKAYSTAAKGMTHFLTPHGAADYLARVFGGNTTLKSLGFGKKLKTTGLAIATSDTLTKAPTFLAHQMVSGMGMALGEGIDASYASVGVARADIFKPKLTKAGIQRNYVMGVAKRVAGRMGGATATERGMVLAGAYQLAAAGAKKQAADPRGLARGKFGLGSADLTTITRLLGGEVDETGRVIKSSEALKVAQQGVAIGRHTFMTGPQANIYGANLASLEPRMWQQMQYQLTNMYGFTGNETNDFMTALMARKTTAPGELDALQSLTRMQQTVMGQRLEILSGKPSVGVQEFMEAGVNTEAMQNFLRKHGAGFTLDLADTAGMGSVAGGRVTGWAKQAFGGMTSLSMAGGDIMEAIKGTTIQTATGESKEIGGQYARALEHFAQNISRASASIGKSDEEVRAAKQAMLGFRGEMAEVWAGAFNRIMSGKLRGTGWAVGMGLSFSETAGTLGLTAAQKAAGRKVVSSTMGQGMFAQSGAFLDSMREFMGGATDELMALGMDNTKARRTAADEGSQRLMRFFLGMESKTGQYQGITQLVGRHPALGLSHTGPAEVFRAPMEVGALGGTDEAWTSFTKTGAGRRALAQYKKKAGVAATSFQSMRATSYTAEGVLKAGNKGAAARQFFGSMLSNMDSFFGDVGGGAVFFPKIDAEIHYANVPGKRSIEMSIASAMGGDHDGDMYYLMNPAGANRKRLAAAVGDPEAMARLQSYRMRRNIFAEEAKRGISNLAASQMPITDINQMVMQGVMKEQAGKAVGPVDLALDRIRFGVMQAEGTSPEKEKLLSLMDVLEETMTIKGKKLPREMGLSEIMTRAIGAAAEGDVEAFSSVLRNVAFKDSHLLSPGAAIGDVTIDGPAAGKLGDFLQRFRGLDISLDPKQFEATIGQALEHSRVLGVDRAKTIRQLMGIGTGNTQERVRAFEAMAVNQGAIASAMSAGQDLETAISSTIGNASHRVSAASRKFDKRLLGPLALGVAGALAMGAAMGTDGYSPSPMVMPGEVIRPQVRQQIATGGLFQASKAAPPVESLNQPANNYANIGNRPINASTAYFSRQNAYSMRGEITNLSGISMMSDYMRSTGSRGSVTINDNRRPITANYIDRLMDT